MAFDSMRRVYDASRDPSTEKVRMTPLVSPSKKLQLLYGHTRSPKHSPAHRFRRFVSGVSLSWNYNGGRVILSAVPEVRQTIHASAPQSWLVLLRYPLCSVETHSPNHHVYVDDIMLKVFYFLSAQLRILQRIYCSESYITKRAVAPPAGFTITSNSTWASATLLVCLLA